MHNRDALAEEFDERGVVGRGCGFIGTELGASLMRPLKEIQIETLRGLYCAQLGAWYRAVHEFWLARLVWLVRSDLLDCVNHWERRDYSLFTSFKAGHDALDHFWWGQSARCIVYQCELRVWKILAKPRETARHRLLAGISAWFQYDLRIFGADELGKCLCKMLLKLLLRRHGYHNLGNARF